MQNKVYQGYQTLNALLSPVPPPSGEIESELRRLIAGYANREDWVHAVVVFGNQGKIYYYCACFMISTDMTCRIKR